MTRGSMPFGKFKGTRLADVPLDYLEWLAGRELREPLCSAVREELRRRGGSSPRGRGVHLDFRIAAEIVEAGRRSLARHHHPDAGGSATVMQSVNATADVMLAQLRGLT